LTSQGVLLIVEIVLFALGAMLSVWGVLRLARRQGGASGWMGSLQRALLGPAAALPLAAGLLAAVLGANAQTIFAAALGGLLLGDGLAAWALLRLPRASVLPQAGQVLAQHSGDGVLVLDERGRVLIHNPAAQAVFGAEPLAGRPLAELLAVWWQPALQLWEEGQTDFEVALPTGNYHLRALPLETDTQLRRVILVTDLSRQRELERQLAALQTTDVLTGLANRPRLLEMASREVYRACRYHRPLSVAMLRVAGFSALEDQHGHAAAEQVLRALAQRTRENIRLADSAGRWGEDTFALLLPETTLAQGCQAAERIRRILSGTPIPTDRGEVNVALSAGVTALDEEALVTVDLLLDQAARALYAAGSGQVASFTAANQPIAPRLAAEPVATVRLNRQP